MDDRGAAGRRHALIGGGRPPAGALQALQAGAAHRPRRRHRRAGAARRGADGFLPRRRARPDRDRRRRPWSVVPVHHRGGAELGGAEPARRRHRHDELLPRARLDLHRHRLRRARAGGGAVDPRCLRARGARWPGCGARLPLGVRHRRRLSGGRVPVHPLLAGEAAARLGRRRGRLDEAVRCA